MSKTHNTGISLIESLISIAVLAIGMLSMLQYSGNTMLAVSNNTPHAQSLRAAAEQFAMMQIIATNDIGAFRDELDLMYNGGAGNEFTFGNNQTYRLQILDARSGFNQNANVIDPGANEIVADPAVWEPPLSLGIQVSFTDRSGQEYSSITPITVWFN